VKINDVRVDGFGVWTDLTLSQLSPEVTVFFGPNEAGKTTLMQLVRAVLYGYSPDRRRRYLPPVFGGKPGGSLIVQGSRGRFTIDRRADRSDSSGLGKVSVQGESGAAQGQHLLSVMLSGVDESIFNNVFAVGLREIQELGTLTGTQAASHLFALTAGMDRVSLVDVMRDLRGRRSKLVAADDGQAEGALARLISQREKLREEIKQLRGATSQWVELVGQLTASDEQTKDAEAEVAELEHQLQVVELADRIRERWLQQQEIQAEIDELEPLPALPEDAVSRYDELTEQINQQQALCDDWKAQWAKLRDQARALPINEGLRRNCCRIEALGEQEGWLNSIRDHIKWLHEEINNVETELFTEREELGLGDGFDWQRLPEVRDHAEQELAGYWKAIETAQANVERTREEVASRRQNAKQLDEKFDSALSELGEDDLSGAIEKAGEHVTMLRRRMQLDERMDSLRRHRRELEEEGDDLAEDQVLSLRAIGFIGFIFCSGIVLILTGVMHQWFGLTPTYAWICGFAGVGALLGSLILKTTMERIAAGRLDDCDEELDRVVRQMKKAKKEIEELDAELPSGSGPLASRVHEAEQTLARLEELVPMDADRAEARERDQAAQARARQAAADLKTARNNWREALAASDLPDDLTPEQIQRMTKRCDYITQLADRLASRREELDKRNHELISLTSRINRLSDEVGVKAASREPVELLHAIVTEHADQQDLLQERDELRKQGKELRNQYGKAARQTRKLNRLRREVLHEANVAGEEELRELAAQVERHGELTTLREQLESEIDAIIGDVSLEEIEVEMQGGDKEAIAARYEAVSSQLAEAELRQKELYQTRGRLAEQTKSLEADRRLREAQFELACVEQRIKQSARQWRTLAATGAVLESVRHIYETERQPATLSDASKYLQRMTEGRYVRVWTPLDEDTLLVDDAHGNSLGIEVLSAGTREQVFLALRLALVAMYARRGAKLPLVLDDVLVNCDAVRAKLAAKVLCEFAADGHQLLIFTCHEHIMRIFQVLHADVRKLPVRSELGPAELEELDREELVREEALVEPDEEPAALVDMLDHLPVNEPEEEAEPEEDPVDELIEELDDEIFETPEPEQEPEPVDEIEPEPIEYEPPRPIVGDETWQEDQPPGEVEEPFAALLQHAGDRRSPWTSHEERAWEEVD